MRDLQRDLCAKTATWCGGWLPDWGPTIKAGSRDTEVSFCSRVQTLWFKTLHDQDLASGKIWVTERVKVVAVATHKLLNLSVSKNECLKRVRQLLWVTTLFRKGCRWQEQVQTGIVVNLVNRNVRCVDTHTEASLQGYASTASKI